MQETACILCSNDCSTLLFEGQDRLHGGPGRFAVRRCCSCEAVYLSPRPSREEMSQYYPQEYAPYTLGTHLSVWQRWNLRYAVSKQVRAVLSRVAGPGWALDVGCATGLFLDGLQQEGWQVRGVELNPGAATRARQLIGQDKVQVGDFEQVSYPDCAFDLVTFWDVLEHLPDPRRALLRAACITRPGGSLVLSLPNLESLEARLFGRYWAGWDIPRHLWWLPHSGLVRLLGETGWAVQDLICLRGRHWLLSLSFRLWLAERHLPASMRRALVVGFESLPLKGLLWPYFVIAERMKVGSITVVFAQRKEG